MSLNVALRSVTIVKLIQCVKRIFIHFIEGICC
jgi:hypothetical protein